MENTPVAFNLSSTAASTASENTDIVFHNSMVCQKVQSRPLLSIYSKRGAHNKGLFMIRVFRTEGHRKNIYQEVGITLLYEAGVSELGGNITFRKILFFIRLVSASSAFNNIHPHTKERITQALGA